MDRTPPTLTLAAARALRPPEGSRDEFYVVASGTYVVASGTARYQWDTGEAMIGPGNMMFAAAHTSHGYDQFSDDFSVWVVFYGPEK